MTSKLHPR